MKKIIITLVFSMIAIVAFAFSSHADTLYASAANDFSVSVKKLTAAEGDYAQAGDYKVTVSLEQNTGFRDLSFLFLLRQRQFYTCIECAR